MQKTIISQDSRGTMRVTPHLQLEAQQVQNDNHYDEVKAKNSNSVIRSGGGS